MTGTAHHEPALLGTYKTALDNQTVSYTLKRSYRAKHARLEIRPETGLTVVVPNGYRAGDVKSLLMKKKRWVLEHLSRYGNGYSPGTKEEVKDGDSVPYLGRKLKVVERHDHGNAISIFLEKNRLVVNLDSRKVDGFGPEVLKVPAVSIVPRVGVQRLFRRVKTDFLECLPS